MVNGHFVSDPGRGGAFHIFSDFPSESIQRIEIIRGPGSALYGSNATNGVLQVNTVSPENMKKRSITMKKSTGMPSARARRG